jgi:predicted nucleic acid-binding protein
VIAVDTNILVYAHRTDSEWHDRAAICLRELAEGRAPWAIPWPCIHEFLAIVTHPRIYDPPTPVAAALDQIDAWFESPSLVLLTETIETGQQVTTQIKSHPTPPFAKRGEPTAMAKVAQNDQCLRSNRTGRNILTGALRDSADSRGSGKSATLPDVGGVRGGACRVHTRPTYLAETPQRHALT